MAPPFRTLRTFAIYSLGGLLGLLSACTTDVRATKVKIDADSDGYLEEVDCDDSHATIHPDAEEVCDGVDNNCDDRVDEDAADGATWYADADADTYGDATQSTVSCEPPEGHVADATDCDDANADVHPDAEEICNDLDDNCDGGTDDDAADAPTWYLDEDGDGWGGDTSASRCDAEGWVTDPADCDDTNPDVYPGAPEVCDTADTDEDCDGLAEDLDPDSTGQVEVYTDADGDSYGAGSARRSCDPTVTEALTDGDCDDARDDVSPDGAEICDAADTDEDCDGLIDDDDPDVTGVGTWYRDRDGDAYGDDATASTSCDAPTGYVSLGGDCDDYTADLSPGATEVCDDDDADEDCDGLTDDDDPGTDPASIPTWYRDADTDGYGDPDRTREQCDPPSGYTEDGTDCDDGDGAIHPSAAEICDDGDTDEDCDGLADDDDPGATGGSTTYADADGDGYGAGLASVACDPASDAVSTDDDCDDSRDDVNPGAAEVCDAADTDEDCDGVADPDCGLAGEIAPSDADVTMEGVSSYQQLGFSLVSGLDFTGDGLDDLVVGAPREGDGAVHVLRGDTLPPGTSAVTGLPWFTATGSASLSYAGYEVTWLGDVDQDGYDDVATQYYTTMYTVGVLDGPQTEGGSGALSTVGVGDYACQNASRAGTSDSTTGEDEWLCGEYHPPSDWDMIVYSGWSTEVGRIGGDRVVFNGYEVHGGEDVDGDGLDDYVAGLTAYSGAGYSSGGAAVVYLAPLSSGTTTYTDWDMVTYGENASDLHGSQARLIADVTGDGLADLYVGTPYDDAAGTSAGRVTLFGSPLATSQNMSDGEVQILGAQASDILGLNFYCVSWGDVDGDAQSDVLVGTTNTSIYASKDGAAWLVLGSLSGTYALSDGDYDARFVGDDDSTALSFGCAMDGDLNDDGKDDVVLGAPGHDAGTVGTAGAVYVWYGE